MRVRRSSLAARRSLLAGCVRRRRRGRRRAPAPAGAGGRRARSSTATPSSSTSAGDEERVRLIGIDTPETVEPGPPGRVLRPRGLGAHWPSCCPTGTAVRLERDVEARDRYDRLLAYVYRADDGAVREPARSSRRATPSPLTYPAQRRPRRASSTAAAAAARASRRGPVGRLRRHRRARSAPVASAAVTTLAERLGYGPDDRLLIVNCDDLGSSHAANVGVYEALRDGHRHQRHADGARARGPARPPPATGARTSACTSPSTPSTTSTAGGRSPTRRRCSTATAASPARSTTCGTTPTSTRCAASCRAQVERAILWGFDVSHLDSHMGTLQLRPEFFDVYLDLAVEFGLPLRLSGRVDRARRSASRSAGWPPRRAWCSPTTSSSCPGVGLAGARSSRSSATCGPGVTEVYVHPAVDTPELRALAPDWAARVDDHAARHRRRRRSGAMLERAGVAPASATGPSASSSGRRLSR